MENCLLKKILMGFLKSSTMANIFRMTKMQNW